MQLLVLVVQLLVVQLLLVQVLNYLVQLLMQHIFRTLHVFIKHSPGAGGIGAGLGVGLAGVGGGVGLIGVGAGGGVGLPGSSHLQSLGGQSGGV